MSNDFEEIRRYFNQCDPKTPLEADDPRYVDLNAARGDQPRSAVASLARAIRLWNRPEPSCQLFSGFPGSGKTTELKRLVEALSTSADFPTHVIYIDAEEHLNPWTPIYVEDVLRMIAWEVDRELARVLGRAPDAPDSFPRRFWDFLTRTNVDVKGLGTGIGVGGVDLGNISAELKYNPSFRQKVHEVMSHQLRAFKEEAHAAIREAVVQLKTRTGAREVVVIVDSLEKLKAASIEQEDLVERSAETVFLTHADFLRLPCHVIYTFPLWLQYQLTGLGTAYDNAPLVLPMVKVADQDGTPNRAGREKLVEMLEKRVQLERIFGQRWQEHIGTLVDASGGYPRDLIRLIRDVLLLSEDTLPVDAARVEQAIQNLAESYTNVFRTQDLELLATIAETHQLPMIDDARVRRLNRLFVQMVILCYRNGEPWFDLHPLIRRKPEVVAAIEQRREKQKSAG